ncbi:hypothetical protein BJ508DRAFT_95717 [Ascobolus immersus RN42]|uniref:F-box domain-containing protein n=1 Tax=Ascobolus immersus RN42 TaxID=1160509 RepID=A0A3N4ILS1_ASCIM|nr:hypothetical protein BJ508DRAFT_95717 [Ascobolus immersus RN42]
MDDHSSKIVFPLLDLPTELRLEIYSQCSALTLLQLSHTCASLNAEINSRPSIFKKAPGYRTNNQHTTTPALKLKITDIYRATHISEKSLITKLYPNDETFVNDETA